MTEAARRPGGGDRTPPPPQLTFAPIEDPRISNRARVLLWALCRWAWGSRAECWPSNRQVAELLNVSRRTVQLGIAELVRAGYLASRMERSDRGSYRVLTLTERSAALRLVGPPEEGRPGGGGATPCATPGATPCATPAQAIAPPGAQSLAPKFCLESSKEEKRMASPPLGPSGPGGSPADGHQVVTPSWLNVDVITEEQAAHWRGVVAAGRPTDPLVKIARRILDRFEAQRRRPGGR